ncbi:MAG TPA: hypothetical protein VKK81_24270 [Candidatus Binatia bacterium]|nr:hypothetical protein [Candidatus Binatia bacterium]
MWSQDLLLIVQTFLVFLGLSFLYWIVFKRVQWRSLLAQALTGHIRLGVYLLIPHCHPPAKVEEISLGCVHETKGVCAQPAPEVWLSAYQDFAILYSVKFWIEDFARYHSIESDVLKSIWYRFRRDKIPIPFPIREIYYHGEETATDTLADSIHRFKDIEFLQILSDEQLRELAGRIETHCGANFLRAFAASFPIIEGAGGWCCDGIV